MGWFDKAKAAAEEAKRMAKEAAYNAKDMADVELGRQQWYADAKETAGNAIDRGRDIATEAKDMAGEALGEIGQTKVGQQVGGYTRTFTSRLAALPVFSLSGDVMRTRHGIRPLYAHLKEEPDDPVRYVWLAEAMGRVMADSATYSRIRAVVHPGFYVLGQAVKAASTLGSQPSDPTTIRLLKNAFAISTTRIRKDPRDPAALHALARVYRAQGDAPEAVRFSKLAYVADPNNHLPMVTLAQLYLGLGQTENARRAAERATDGGAGYAHTVLADLVLLDEYAEPQGRIERYSAARDRVTKRDREAYLGPSVEGVGVLEGVGRAQLEKLGALFS